MLETYKRRIIQSKTIDNRLIEYLETSKKRYLYGSELQTAVCLGIFRDMKLAIQGILLPPGSGPKQLKGYWGRLLRKAEMVRISEMSPEEKHNAYVMLSVPQTEYDSARLFLQENEICNVINCCWLHNSELIELCYDVWQQEVEHS